MREQRDYVNFALIKPDSSSVIQEYIIMDILNDGMLVLEDYSERQLLLDQWIKLGVGIFDSIEKYREKYPPMSPEERLARGRVFLWRNISKEKWTNEISDYFENDPYWREFRSRNNF